MTAKRIIYNLTLVILWAISFLYAGMAMVGVAMMGKGFLFISLLALGAYAIGKAAAALWRSHE